MIPSTDYHDYVIKDGKLIGDFEEMYRNSKEVPWHQDKTNNEIQSKVFVEIIRHFANRADLVIEVGCGLGYFTNMLKTAIPDVFVTGCDVSDTALTNAIRLQERIPFFQADIRIESVPLCDVIVLKDVLWYLIPEIDTVIQNLYDSLNDNGIVAIQLYIPSGDYYGREVFWDAESIAARFSLLFNAEWLSEMRCGVNSEMVVHVVLRKKGGQL